MTTPILRKPRFGFNTHGNVIHLSHNQSGRNVTIIAAMDSQNGIGIDNRMPWHVPPDMEQFKRLTEGHTVIMGRKTYQSLPLNKTTGTRALPNRTNIVLSRDPGFLLTEKADPPNLWLHDDLEIAIATAPTQQVFIIGGGEIYRQALDKDLVDDLILTRFQKRASCDTYFPTLFSDMWQGPIYSTHDHIDLRFSYQYRWRKRKE